MHRTPGSRFKDAAAPAGWKQSLAALLELGAAFGSWLSLPSPLRPQASRHGWAQLLAHLK